jgi:hypothetical protein
MALKSQMEVTREGEEALLQGDSRWELVQRILASEDFQRAAQLRNILSHISGSAILRPNNVLSEVEIACDVLERRPDFNPANDNIVRAQVSHLRRKLEHYFDTEGRDEPLVLTIPKGSYIPVFTPVQARASLPVIAKPTQGEPVDAPAEDTNSASVQTRSALPWWRKWTVGIVALFSAAFLVLALLFLRDEHLGPEDRKAPLTNPFVLFLARSEGDVTVVMPDTSLAMIQHIVGTNIPVSDYISNDFPQQQMAMVKDPTMRGVISDLGDYRTTSVNEAMIAFDFLKTLQGIGAHATIRYARDLHVHDLSEGNTILIGGPTSDPWVSLFVNQMNFRQVDDPTLQGKNYFENRHPASGEQSLYMNTYSNQSVGYVDITLTQNPSQSGYVLLISGADLQANEAASRFLLHGKFPPEISSVLSRKDLRYFELLLHGKHMVGEADDSFELVALRPK